MITSFEQIEKIVEEHIELIKIDGPALVQAKDRAAIFLVVESVLANHLKSLEDAKASLTTLVEASYAQAIMSATGKNITENKITASIDTVYTNSREATEKVDAEINWTKTHLKIFENAHLFFRQLCRE